MQEIMQYILSEKTVFRYFIVLYLTIYSYDQREIHINNDSCYTILP